MERHYFCNKSYTGIEKSWEKIERKGFGPVGINNNKKRRFIVLPMPHKKEKKKEEKAVATNS